MTTLTKKIIYIPDLIRNQPGYPEAFLNLIKEPIRQGLSLEIEHICKYNPFVSDKRSFSLDKFYELLGKIENNDLANHQNIWRNTFFNLPKEATNYITQYLSSNSIVISFEMPPWLKKICGENNIEFIDIRPSPLHFCRDLTLAIQSSNTEISQRITKYELDDDQLYLEAAILTADIQLHKSNLTLTKKYNFENLDNTIIIVGQTPFDSSLLLSNGSFLRFNDFSEKLKYLCNNKAKIVYKHHPKAEFHAPGFIKNEKLILEKILEREIFQTNQNAYQIIGSDADIELVGISSGLLQEAKYFKKRSHILHKSLVPLKNSEDNNIKNYQQIFFSTLISPYFWKTIIKGEIEKKDRKDILENIPHNYGRHILDAYWDYSKVLTWERTIPNEIFMRNGGASLQRRVEILEEKINHLLNERKE